MSKVKHIRPVLGFAKLKEGEFLSRTSAIHAGLTGNPAYPDPPVSMEDFSAAIESYRVVSAASLDRGKRALAERASQRESMFVMLRRLGHYVEGNCKGDMATFLSSGFEAISRVRVPSSAPPQPNIVRVDQGNSGQLLINIKALRNVRSYELRYAALGSSGMADNWMTSVVATATPAVPVASLTPGTAYTFQVRAFSRLGYTDWSDSVNRICI